MFEKFDVATAQQILGEDVWKDILENERSGVRATIYFEAEGAKYMVAHAHTKNDGINVYLTRLPD